MAVRRSWRPSLDLPERPGRQHDRRLPGRSRNQGPAACCLLAADQALLRADEPRLHGLRALQGRVHRRSALRWRHAVHVSAEGREHMGNFIAWDAAKGKIVWSNKEQFSVWSGVLTTAGGIACDGTLEGYFKCVDQKDGKELYKFKHSVRHHRQRVHLRPQGQAVHRRLLGRRWLGRHRSRGWSDQPDRWSRRRRWLRWPLRSYTALGGSLTVFTLP